MAGRKPIYSEPMIRRSYQITEKHDEIIKTLARDRGVGESAALRFILERAEKSHQRSLRRARLNHGD